MFGGSRTVRDDHLVTRQFVDVVENLTRGNEPRAGNVTHVVGVLITNIHEESLAFLDQRFEFFRGDTANTVRIALLQECRRALD